MIPFLGVFVGSYIIFITYSIMNGMENEIQNKISSFNYKYVINESDVRPDYQNVHALYQDTLSKSYNSGYKKIVFLEKLHRKTFVELIAYEDIQGYLDKIVPYIKYSNVNLKNGIILGDDLASSLVLNLGDSIEVYFPTEINFITGNVPSLNVPITAIYDFNIFDFDSRYIIAPKNLINDINSKNINLFFSDFFNYGLPSTEDDMLISAIQLEKKIYTGLSFILILISCVMIFNIMIMVMIDKIKQIEYLNISGLSNNKIFMIMLLFNTLTSLFFTFMGYFISELTIFSNYYYGMFSMIFNSLPFKITPLNISFNKFILLYLVINFLIIFFSTLPYKLKRDFQ